MVSKIFAHPVIRQSLIAIATAMISYLFIFRAQSYARPDAVNMGLLEFTVDSNPNREQASQNYIQPVQVKADFAYWKISITNNSPKNVTRVLWNIIPVKQWHLTKVDSSKNLVNFGDFLPSNMEIDQQKNSIAFDIAPGKSEYLLYASISNLPAAFLWQLASEDKFLEITSIKTTSTWYFIITLLTMWIYSSIYFTFLKNIHFFFYLGGMFFLALLMIILNGLPLPLKNSQILMMVKCLPFFISLAYIFIAQSIAIILKFNTLKKSYIIVSNIIFCAISAIILTLNMPEYTQILAIFCIFELTFLLAIFLHYRKMAPHKYWAYYFVTNIPIVVSVYTVALMFAGFLPYSQYIFIYVYAVMFLVNVAVPILMNFIGKDMEMESTHLEGILHLGRSVQNLILPKNMSARSNDGEHMFIYKPFDAQMSGDWIFHWEDKSGSKHYLIGDVIGKGPSAAIAVAMIATIVERSKRLEYDVFKTISEINGCLFEKFNGQILTTGSGATITRNGEAILYNAGGLGWLYIHQAIPRHILGRSILLGFKKALQLNGTPLILQKGDFLVSFTDGFSMHPRHMRTLSSILTRLVRQNKDVETISMKLASLPARSKDDQAMILFQYMPENLHRNDANATKMNMEDYAFPQAS